MTHSSGEVFMRATAKELRKLISMLRFEHTVTISLTYLPVGSSITASYHPQEAASSTAVSLAVRSDPGLSQGLPYS